MESGWRIELRKFNNVANIRKLLPNDVIYLQNESCEVRCFSNNRTVFHDPHFQILGYKFFGSPVQCKHRNWAFNVRRGRDILDVWNKIPDGIKELKIVCLHKFSP